MEWQQVAESEIWCTDTLGKSAYVARSNGPPNDELQRGWHWGVFRDGALLKKGCEPRKDIAMTRAVAAMKRG